MSESEMTNGINKDVETQEIKPRNPNDPKATAQYKGQWYSDEEATKLRRADRDREIRKETRERWEQTPQGQLCTTFYKAFQAYKEHMKANPMAMFTPYGPRVDYDEHKLFEEGLRMLENQKQEREEKLRRNLEKAQKAARCQHFYVNGRQCGAPRVKGKKLCHMHERLEEATTKMLELDLGPMEDADSIQVGIKKLQRAIIEGKLTHRQVGQLAYTIQLAAWNVTRTSMAAREKIG